MMTEKKAIDLVKHVPHGVSRLKIWHASFGLGFMEALINKVGSIEKDVTNRKLEELVIHYAKVGEKENDRLAEEIRKVLRISTTIELLRVYSIDLIREDNVKVWIEDLMANTTLTSLMLNHRVNEAVEKEIRKATETREPALELLHQRDFSGKGKVY